MDKKCSQGMSIDAKVEIVCKICFLQPFLVNFEFLTALDVEIYHWNCTIIEDTAQIIYEAEKVFSSETFESR